MSPPYAWTELMHGRPHTRFHDHALKLPALQRAQTGPNGPLAQPHAHDCSHRNRLMIRAPFVQGGSLV